MNLTFEEIPLKNLEQEELFRINGGIVCGGLCVAFVAGLVVGLVVGGAVVYANS